MHIDTERIRADAFSDRTTLQSLASSLKISKTKAAKLLKEGIIRRHSNAIKPFLKDANKISRLKFCISMLEENSLPHEPIFKGMFNTIHIDEKWFYLTKESENYYMLPDEFEPVRTCKSKNFIGKVMFLAVVARPRFDAQGNEVFSEKIGLFPFVTYEPAKRNSANRVAGNLETKPITSVTRNIMRSFFIEKLLRAIREKWPSYDRMNPIFIQQDNAKTHIDPNDIEFCEAAK
ncbi:hypothetical protein M5689_024545 [Euphorbia peplus]|nr:hypothetical protein M5689_024545 [Euphorbia peplus]